MENRGEIIIYQTADGQTRLGENNVHFLHVNRDCNNTHYLRVNTRCAYFAHTTFAPVVSKSASTGLMIDESRSEEKDVMVKLVVNLINKNNK